MLAALCALHLALLPSCAEPAHEPESGAVGPVAAVDDLGRRVELAGPADRLVALLPAATEAIFALGAGDRVVGRTRYDEGVHLAHLPSVGGGLDPNLEALVALRPDLVVAWESPTGSKVRVQLESMGIAVFAAATRDTLAIFRMIEGLGTLTGHRAGADSLARSIRAELESVRASVPPGPRPTVLYVIGTDPVFVAGTENFISELIEVAGGHPVQISADRRGVSPQVSLEALVRLQPDVLIVPGGDDPAASLERLRQAPGWRELDALREGRAVAIPRGVVLPGPGIGGIARLFREILDEHPVHR